MYVSMDRTATHGAQDVVMLSSCLPRRCGIATFSHDLRNGLLQHEGSGRVGTIALNNNEIYYYPEHVIFEIDQDHLEEYYHAAQFVNASNADVISLQHEFGLFGGPDGRYILAFLDHVRKPVVTTFHTLPQNPSAGQEEMIRKITAYSHTVVIMNPLAVDIIQNKYRIPTAKFTVIPHGIKPVRYREPSYYKNKMMMQDRLLLLTFGFLAQTKGLRRCCRPCQQ